MAKDTKATHTRPDFTVKYDQAKYESAQKQIESKKQEAAKLNEELNKIQGEIAILSSVHPEVKPGFSNAKPAKEQLADSQRAQANNENLQQSTATKNTAKK